MCREEGRTFHRKGTLCGKVLWKVNRKKLKGSVAGMPKWRWNLGWRESGKGGRELCHPVGPHRQCQ